MVQQLVVFVDVWVLQLYLRSRVCATLAEINRFESHSRRRVADTPVTELRVVFIFEQGPEQIAPVGRPGGAFADLIFEGLDCILKRFVLLGFDIFAVIHR